MYLGSLSGTALGAALFVGFWLVVVLVCAMLVRHFVDTAVLKAHNDICGFILAVVGVVYAVLLAFVAIGAWERFASAEVHTYNEATALTEVYRDIGVFPQSKTLRREIRVYSNEVVANEWPAMQKGGSSPMAGITLEHIAQQVRNLRPDGAGLTDVHTNMLSSMDQALLERADRLSMDADGLNQEVWATLFIGAFVTIGFALMFGFESRIMQMLLVGGLTVSIAIVFYLAIALDYPFQGRIHVEPTAFVNALHQYDVVDRY